MAVVAARVSVTGAATKICENTSGGTDTSTRSYLLIPQAATGIVALGPVGVTSATGDLLYLGHHSSRLRRLLPRRGRTHARNRDRNSA